MCAGDSPYVVTPGLVHKIREFEAHVKVARRAPILISGPSGAGKSLFLHLFKALYQAANEEKKSIVTVNCSHFTGEIARSELFGHIKGAFTGAVYDKDGWIRMADGGVLILEEVGDLPLETQAKLLTFIEDGLFHKVGSSKIETADVQIVAATNREKKLREDFKYRFLPFVVPGLHQRRQDVLYHLAIRFPELVSSLMPWELLTLLAYNWPGNVRELERVGLLLQRAKLLEDQAEFELLQEAISLLEKEKEKSHAFKRIKSLSEKGGLADIADQPVALGYQKVFQIHTDLEKHGIDIPVLESILNPLNLSLSINNRDKPFVSLNPGRFHSHLKRNDRLKVRYFSEIPAFRDTYRGFQKFCTLFWQSHTADRNLLDINREFFPDDLLPASGFIELSKKELCATEALHGWLKRHQSPQDGFSTAWSGSYGELIRRYLSELMESSGGNKAQAAKKAGIKYTSFIDKLKKHGIT